MIPRAALEQEREQEAIATIALRGVRRAWRRMARGNWERNWRDDVGPNIQQVVLEAQSASAASADAYVAAVLAELGIEPEVPTALNVDALVGVGGDGRPVESLTYGAVIESVKAQYEPSVLDLPPDQALQEAMDAGQTWMDAAIATILADTARAAETASTAQRTWVTGYVRMIEPGACSRCVILAGKRYRWNEGFLRHPRCRCRHIPAAEAMAGDLTTDPQAYFDSLPSAADLNERYPDLTVAMRRQAGLYSQEDVFTKAGAEAVRLGADIRQVVNARRGMYTAQHNVRGWIPKGRMTQIEIYGRKAFVTTEGTTVRGLAGKNLGELEKIAGRTYRSSKIPRLMPETILAEAKSPEDAVRLLKRFGYIL